MTFFNQILHALNGFIPEEILSSRDNFATFFNIFDQVWGHPSIKDVGFFSFGGRGFNILQYEGVLNRGGWNKRVGVQKLQNQLDFFHQFLS